MSIELCYYSSLWLEKCVKNSEYAKDLGCKRETIIVMSDEIRENVLMEIDALKAIYLNDIEVISDDTSLSHRIIVNLLPSTGDIKTSQHVMMTLICDICSNYPNEIPKYSIHKTRGLSDENINELRINIEKFSSNLCGNLMLYDVIEHAKDRLTLHNFPVNRCSICLYEFTRDDVFVKTECFHHLHSRCLSEYIFNELHENEEMDKSVIQCPVCRQNIDTSSIKDPEAYPLPYLSLQSLVNESALIEESKNERIKYNEIFEKQKQNGGIIDRDAESKRFFIRISEEYTNETSVLSHDDSQEIAEENVSEQ